MATTEAIGTWFPSGFHGHFRSKSRLDFLNEYRHLAKPIPPQKFIRRAQARLADHTFSKHDNRNSFMNDALYFEQGLGKRRLENQSTRFHPNLLSWRMNKQPYPTASREAPLASTYRVDFRGARSTPHQQTIVTRPKTSFDEAMPMTTSYRYSHDKDNPNQKQLNAMSNQSFTGSMATSSRKLRVASAPLYRESVASCMSWSTGQQQQFKQDTTTLPACSMVPHPPEAPKTATSCAIAIQQPTAVLAE